MTTFGAKNNQRISKNHVVFYVVSWFDGAKLIKELARITLLSCVVSWSEGIWGAKINQRNSKNHVAVLCCELV